MRVAALWPRPRRERIDAALRDPAVHPDSSDALLFLEPEGFTVTVEDPYRFPLNPLARSHEVFCGLDPLRALRVALRRPRYDAALAIGASSAWFTERFLRLKRPRVPVIMIDPAIGPWKLRQRMQDVAIPRMDRVILFGRVQVAHLDQAFGGRVRGVFIPHRADARFYDPATPALNEQAERYILAIGDDVSRDFATLVCACAEDAPLGRLLAARDLRCIIHTRRGLGPLPPRVVHSARRVTHVELRDLYRHAEAVVLPLFDRVHAGGINSLVEAMAMARPLVVGGSRGIADYVRDGETALTVPCEDAGALGRAVIGVLEDRSLAARIGTAARAFVLSECASPVYAGNVARVIREVVAEAVRKPPR